MNGWLNWKIPPSRMSKYFFIADFFVDQVLGGGELNNEELIDELGESDAIRKINSPFVTLDSLQDHKDDRFIISNFVNLSPQCKTFLQKECEYIIYEHDHKYLRNRNPAIYKDYIAPKGVLINVEFYKNAKAVFCQSAFHSNIVKKNLNIENVVNLSGNLWSLKSLDKMLEFASKEKRDAASIMFSATPHKNTEGAKLYCQSNNMEYHIIPPSPYEEFLDQLSDNKTFVFFPKTPETLSRVIVEARMMGMSVITNGNVGAAQEEWFSLKGAPLIKYMREKRGEIVKKVVETY